MSWLFKETEHSQMYFKYRPPYPSSVFKLINEKLKENYETMSQEKLDKHPKVDGKWKLAVDVGCGTGLSTLALSDYFHETIGIDSSETQISEAIKASRKRNQGKVTFHCGAADSLTSLVGESSVDLVTAAQALHWFDKPKFYVDCHKVLRPGGMLAAYGYTMTYFEDKRYQEILDEFFDDVITKYGDNDMLHVLDGYEKLFPEFNKYFPVSERNDSITSSVDSTVEDYVGFLGSLSPYRKYLTLNPGKEDPLKILYEKTKQISLNSSKTFTRNYKIFILFGVKN